MHACVCVWLPELSIGDGGPTEGKSHTEGNGVTEGDWYVSVAAADKMDSLSSIL